jgi:uncharacterized Zn finger protein
MAYYDYGWMPYVTVAERRRRAEKQMRKLLKKGQTASPITLQGRTIARTFWGKAWCDNLERYSDYANRLPRGRAYVRNGSVIDLQVVPGKVIAAVSGTVLYHVVVEISPVPEAQWRSICNDSAGEISSLVELLQGRFSKAVMERLCQQRSGLFPQPSEIGLSCTCPDWASMCKHVAAVLYGIGARLDEEPGLLFKLRGVDENELIARAGTALPLSNKKPQKNRLLSSEGLAEIFGLEMAGGRTRGEAGKKAMMEAPSKVTTKETTDVTKRASTSAAKEVMKGATTTMKKGVMQGTRTKVTEGVTKGVTKKASTSAIKVTREVTKGATPKVTKEEMKKATMKGMTEAAMKAARGKKRG